MFRAIQNIAFETFIRMSKSRRPTTVVAVKLLVRVSMTAAERKTATSWLIWYFLNYQIP